MLSTRHKLVCSFSNESNINNFLLKFKEVFFKGVELFMPKIKYIKMAVTIFDT